MKKETARPIRCQGHIKGLFEETWRGNAGSKHGSVAIDYASVSNAITSGYPQPKISISAPRLDAESNRDSESNSRLDGAQDALLADVQSCAVVKAVAKRDPKRTYIETKPSMKSEQQKHSARDQNVVPSHGLTADEKYSQARSRIFCEDVASTDSLQDITQRTNM
eukprot:CAMPEP_0201526886 /NCGR_PEP_ID=MMETSP0161_2-20130828/33284_1 /ASSEMBLY_ACC=CAM_ASM_000251 /TAXON_ID=180227 /ORGANISM="Neoparamoeba aestuarina, Strain SoJaBio B1-5/56/2" /LENGTH=164 /DNA_ID=CAMNT_0047927465 /DNA_START=66 /DNA_END=560 /DNA_ORIENTATION=-